MGEKKFKNIDQYLNHWDNFFVQWNNDKEKIFKNNIWINYQGRGNNKLEFDVFPQPYLGDVKNHSVITLNLNPSRSKKNKENFNFEEEYLPQFYRAKSYYEYAKTFPTFNIEFWKKQADWIDRIFQNLEKEKPSQKHIKPFALEMCPWGSKSFQTPKIDHRLSEYMDKYVFDIIDKACENSKLKMVFSVGKVYHDIFKTHGFEKIEEFTKHQNSEPYLLNIDSINEDYEEKLKKIWPTINDKNGNGRYLNRSFSFWRKNDITYFNTWGPGSNNPPGKEFIQIEKTIIQTYL